MAGSVRKRGDKWYYSFETARIDGRRKRIERVGGKTKKEAELALRKALDEYEQKGHIERINSISVHDYLDYWFEQYVKINCRYTTHQAYKNIIENHLKPNIGMYRLRSLSPELLQELINKKYLSGLSRNTLLNIYSLMCNTFKYAVYPLRYINDNPMIYVKLPKQTKVKNTNDVISEEDFKRILERFPADSPAHLPILIGYYTGCRIGEVLCLTWDDINLDKKEICINKSLLVKNSLCYIGPTKTTSSIRVIKIGDKLVSALKDARISQKENKLKYGEYYTKQYRKGDLIISSHLGLPYPEIQMVCTKQNGAMTKINTIKYATRVINHTLNIPWRFHALRHTHATMLIANGANIKDVQQRLGHTNIQTTLGTYTHSTEELSEQTVNIFERISL